MQGNHLYSQQLIKKLNQDIKDSFPHLFLIDTETMSKTFSSVSRMVLLDRYSQKDINHQSISVGDLIICVVKDDPNFPTRGIGYIESIKGADVFIRLEDEYKAMSEELQEDGLIKKQIMEEIGRASCRERV